MKSNNNYKRYFFILLVFFTLFRILYIIYTPFTLSPDETHYWEWSRRLDLSYYSKGPMVAYVIAFFTALFGDTEFGVRAGAVFFSALTNILIFHLGRELFHSEKVGFYGALLSNITPIFSAGAILMTTDAPFVFFWTASIYAFKKAVDTERPLWWYLTGIAIGLGFLSKYTMVLIYPCLLLYLAFSRDRVWLGRKEPYIASLLSLLVSSPVIYWNLTHGLVTVRHTMGQVQVKEGLTVSLDSFLEFIGSQAGLITPIIFIGLAYGVVMCGKEGLTKKKRAPLIVFFTSAPLFGLFLAKSLHAKVQGNWAVASYITAFIGTSYVFARLYENSGIKPRRLLSALAGSGLFIGVAASFLVYFPWALKPFGVKDITSKAPYDKVSGWDELGERVGRMAGGREGKGLFIISDRYQITSELAFYVPGHPVTYNLYNGRRRMNQYDLWPGFEELTGFDAIYVKSGNVEAEPFVKEAFDRCERDVIFLERGRRYFSIFRCYNFHGIKVPESAWKF